MPTPEQIIDRILNSEPCDSDVGKLFGWSFHDNGKWYHPSVVEEARRRKVGMYSIANPVPLPRFTTDLNAITEEIARIGDIYTELHFDIFDGWKACAAVTGGEWTKVYILPSSVRNAAAKVLCAAVVNALDLAGRIAKKVKKGGKYA